MLEISNRMLEEGSLPASSQVCGTGYRVPMFLPYYSAYSSFFAEEIQICDLIQGFFKSGIPPSKFQLVF